MLFYLMCCAGEGTLYFSHSKFGMFTFRSCRLLCLHCIRHWHYRSTKIAAIALLLITFLIFQFVTVSMLMNVSSSEIASSLVAGYGHTYVKPICHARTRFVYIKMIKCASTVLTNVFRRFGLQRRLSFVLPPKGLIYIGWPYEVGDGFYRPSKSSSGFDILCDHAVYNRQKFTELMGPDTIYITSMREPFSQVKSMINYYNVLNISGVPMSVSDRFTEFEFNIDKYEDVYKSAGASQYRFCIPDAFSMTRNLMSFNLGFPTGGFRSKAEDRADDIYLVQQWIADLDADFSFVIIVEYFHESMILLRQLMCWNLTDLLFLVAGNSGTYEFRGYKSPDLVKVYRQWSAVDYQLYQHFNDSLWRKIAAQVFRHFVTVFVN